MRYLRQLMFGIMVMTSNASAADYAQFFCAGERKEGYLAYSACVERYKIEQWTLHRLKLENRNITTNWEIISWCEKRNYPDVDEVVSCAFRNGLDLSGRDDLRPIEAPDEVWQEVKARCASRPIDDETYSRAKCIGHEVVAWRSLQ